MFLLYLLCCRWLYDVLLHSYTYCGEQRGWNAGSYPCYNHPKLCINPKPWNPKTLNPQPSYQRAPSFPSLSSFGVQLVCGWLSKLGPLFGSLLNYGTYYLGYPKRDLNFDNYAYVHAPLGIQNIGFSILIEFMTLQSAQCGIQSCGCWACLSWHNSKALRSPQLSTGSHVNSKLGRV